MHSVSCASLASILTSSRLTWRRPFEIYRCFSKSAICYKSDRKRYNRATEVNFDNFGAWNNRLNLEIIMQQSIKHGKPIPKIKLDQVGWASELGRRKENEDRLIMDELEPNLLYFALFDGHGGSLTADYCQYHMALHIKYWLHREKDLQTVLRRAFTELNNLYTRHLYYHIMTEGDVPPCGTTATVCLLRNGNELVVGSAGDSRAVLSRRGRGISLTQDHQPDRKGERDRIKKAGGFVSWNSVGRPQVCGRLAMTRSIGDVELKRYGVTSIPETRSIEVDHGKDGFLILASDGISFVMSDQEMCDSVGRCKDPPEAAHFIADQSLTFGTDDNVTAMVVPFGAWGKHSGTGNINSFHRNFISSSRA
ncbi:protein phosphatase 1K, mitochondrial-like isoform X1 [Branchiostoma lanceolatum]|uniref:protein phosphatase 1K, mitochondrial-like isoform X1 n=1 Tax=Branchiostoma lanceolatum TaxID=7740 RepID=UPI003453EC6E